MGLIVPVFTGLNNDYDAVIGSTSLEFQAAPCTSGIVGNFVQNGLNYNTNLPTHKTLKETDKYKIIKINK